MFFMIDNADIANYADDSTSYSAGKRQCELEKNNYKKHQSKFVYGSIKMA